MATQLLHDFPELACLTREDLEELLVDPNYFQAIFHSLKHVRESMNAVSELGMANESIANNNMRLQNELYGLRAETQAAFDEAKALQERWKDVDREQKELYSRLSPQFLLMRLRHSTTAQDDLSESLASEFILSAPASGSMTTDVELDRFVKDFKEMRKTYHKRAMWGDRWAGGKVEWPQD